MMLIIVIVALVHIAYMNFKPGIVIAVFPVILFVYMGGQKILFARFILPAVPPLIVLAAFELVKLTERFSFFRQ